MIVRYIVMGKGVNAFINERSFKSKAYAKKKKDLLEELFTDEFFVEEILIEDKDAIIESLKAQLKREMACTDEVLRLNKVKGYPMGHEWLGLMDKLKETVKARTD